MTQKKHTVQWFRAQDERRERREHRRHHEGFMGGESLFGTAVGLAIMLPAIKSFSSTT